MSTFVLNPFLTEENQTTPITNRQKVSTKQSFQKSDWQNTKKEWNYQEDYAKAFLLSKEIEKWKMKTYDSLLNNHISSIDSIWASLNQLYQKTMKLFDEKWNLNERILTFKWEEIEKKIEETHVKEIKKWYHKFDAAPYNYRRHETPKYLNLKKIETALVKQNRFDEAVAIENEIKQWLKLQMIASITDWNYQLNHKVQKIIEKHHSENAVLAKEVKMKYEDFHKLKEKEWESLVQIFKNKKQDIVNIYNIKKKYNEHPELMRRNRDANVNIKKSRMMSSGEIPRKVKTSYFSVKTDFNTKTNLGKDFNRGRNVKKIDRSREITTYRTEASKKDICQRTEAMKPINKGYTSRAYYECQSNINSIGNKTNCKIDKED